jgi:hypothetical protein
MSKPKDVEVIEYTRDKKIAAKDELILDGEAIETPPLTNPTPEKQPEFSWADDSDCVVVAHQPAIAVHFNSVDGIVIRQEDFWGERDQVVYFQPQHAERIAMAILALAKGAK